MTTVTQAFDLLLRNLELTEAERTAASDQQNELRDKLRQELGGIDRDILSGSYSRRTAIRPLHDIDLFIILNRDRHLDVYPSARTQSPLPCLQKVQSALARAYPRKGTPKIQRRSVNIELGRQGIGFDVVPAFEISGGIYMIPDRGLARWINTNPEQHKEILVAANARAGSKLNPLIKAAKRWKQERVKRDPSFPLRSFHLEVLAYRAFPVAPTSYPDGLRALIQHLATAVRAVCTDPATAGPHVDHGMTQSERDQVWRALSDASAASTQALALEAHGRIEEAHFLWRGLLGDDYPERGLAPRGP